MKCFRAHFDTRRNSSVIRDFYYLLTLDVSTNVIMKMIRKGSLRIVTRCLIIMK